MAAGPPQEPTIKLVSSDGQTFCVTVGIARKSITLRTMLDDLQNGADVGGVSDDFIPLPKIKAGILARVIAWCNEHKNDPDPAEDEDVREKQIPPWDLEFLRDVQQGVLFELLLAANYLDIKGFLDVLCQTVANMIKGKGPEEIRQLFNIKNDFTPAEEEQLRRESQWYKDK